MQFFVPQNGRSVERLGEPRDSDQDVAATEPASDGSSTRLHALLTGPAFAVQFLTVVPPLLRRAPHASDFGASEAFFPLVGLLLGIILVAIDGLASVLLSPAVRDVVLIAALAALTGALHLDGVIDTFDGVFGGRDPAGRLAVMRDPRAGAYGVVAVVCLLLLKITALGALPAQLRPFALLLGPCLGRWAIVLATWTFPYARPIGLGRAFKDGIRCHHLALAAAMTVVAVTALAGLLGVTLFLLASAFVLIVGRLVAQRLSGLTGDTYGGLCEVVETGVWLLCGVQALTVPLLTNRS